MSAEPRSSVISLVCRAVLLVLITGSVGVSATSDTWSFTSTGPLAAPGESGSAALVDEGNVLVFGDAGGAAPELYDATNGSFLPVLPLDQMRTGAGGVGLNDGRVLIVGGWNGSSVLDSAVVFDPARRAFAALDGHMTVVRVHPTVTRLMDGRVLVAGGNNGAGLDARADIFDPSTGLFAATGPMAAPRLGTATLLRDGTVLVAGGDTPADGPTDAAELFDPSSASFIPTAAAMSMARRGHQAT